MKSFSLEMSEQGRFIWRRLTEGALSDSLLKIGRSREEAAALRERADRLDAVAANVEENEVEMYRRALASLDASDWWNPSTHLTSGGTHLPQQKRETMSPTPTRATELPVRVPRSWSAWSSPTRVTELPDQVAFATNATLNEEVYYSMNGEYPPAPDDAAEFAQWAHRKLDEYLSAIALVDTEEEVYEDVRKVHDNLDIPVDCSAYLSEKAEEISDLINRANRLRERLHTQLAEFADF